MQEFDRSLAEFAVMGLPSMVLGLFLGPAFGRVSRSRIHGVSLSQIRGIANEICGGPISWSGSPSRPARASEDGDTWVLWVIAAIGVTMLYLKYRAGILVGLLLLAVSMSLIAVFVLTVASRRGVVTHGPGRASAFLVPLLFTAVGTTTVAFLWSPPGGGKEFRAFIAEYEVTGGFGSLEGLLFVAYQILGAAFFILLAVASLLFSIANLAAIYVAVDAWGQILWRSLHRLLGGFGSPWIFLFCGFAALLSLVLSGGWAFEWIDRHQTELPVFPTPTVSP